MRVPSLSPYPLAGAATAYRCVAPAKAGKVA
jgi:hypothetical protein